MDLTETCPMLSKHRLVERTTHHGYLAELSVSMECYGLELARPMIEGSSWAEVVPKECAMATEVPVEEQKAVEVAAATIVR